MRFEREGPDLPDELLLAADENDVIFFCGAGVSRAKANLPDFAELVERVCCELKPSRDGAVSRIRATERAIREASPKIELPTEIGSLVSADRLFGLLETEFQIADIEREVARSLRTPADVDLSAHEILLRLARGLRGRTRLVTTNFDLLFEQASRGTLKPILRDELRPDFDGLVKLHGSARADFEGAEGLGFVLSTGSFGGAYVAEGWAAQFVRALLERHTVVFVGYAADDPPMQYLLEALARMDHVKTNAFAFNPADSTVGRWKARGVTPILYDPQDGHDALWRTLNAWSKRVADPPAWREATVKMALSGPRPLQSFERGQVAHLVSSTPGAKAFRAASDVKPPAEWICVFDPACRFRQPGPEAPRSLGTSDLDPYDLYALDTDPSPEIKNSDSMSKARKVPEHVNNPLRWTQVDRNELNSAESFGLHGMSVQDGVLDTVTNLPPRLCELMIWFRSVAHEPAAIWWAARQPRLHPILTHHLGYNLSRDRPRPCDAAQAWQRIEEAWDAQPSEQRGMAKARFDMEVKELGWSDTMLRSFENETRPQVILAHDNSAIPPTQDAGVSRLRLVRQDVNYREEIWHVEVPDLYLARATSILRRHLEKITESQEDLRVWMFDNIPPIVRSSDRFASEHEYSYGLGGVFFGVLGKLERLSAIDPDAFRVETARWPREVRIFDRLRIWLALDAGRSSPNDAFDLLSSLNDEAFWHQRHTRDLLYALKGRWVEFTTEQRSELEKRLLAGRKHKWGLETDEELCLHSAWASLDAIYWLKQAGVELSLDWDKERERLQCAAPTWTTSSGEGAARSFGSRGGAVEKNLDYSALRSVSPSELVACSAELAGRTQDFMIENDPFLGIVRDDPSLALDAILRSEASIEQTSTALDTYLWESREKHDPARIDATADALLTIPDAVFATSSYAISTWLDGVGRKKGTQITPSKRDMVLDRGIAMLMKVEQRHLERSENDHDWIFEAINAPAGSYVDVLMRHETLPEESDGTGLPEQWRSKAELLLCLPRAHSDLSLALFARSLPYLFAQDEGWARNWLIAPLSDERRAVVIAGLLNVGQPLSPALFEAVGEQLREEVVRLSNDGHSERTRSNEALAFQFLCAWVRTEEGISDDEFTNILISASEPFRLAVLWHCECAVESDATGETTKERIRHLLNKVWPKQAAIRSAAITKAMINIIIAAGNDLPSFKRVAEPFLDRGSDWIALYRFYGENKPIASHPEAVLDLIHCTAPLPISTRPYDLDRVLDEIEAANPALKLDERIKELRAISV